MKIIGIDCGKTEIFVCEMVERPQDLKRFGRTYRPLRLKPTATDIQTLIDLEGDHYIIEPTGSYGYIWVEALQKADKSVLIVSSARVRNFCRYQGLENKSDRFDAAAIALYGLENHSNPKAFIQLSALRIRELYLNLNSTNRSRNPLQNRLGQRLGYECPELVSTYENSSRLWMGEAPAIIRAIAGEEVNGPYSTQRREKMENTIGRGISSHTQSLAKQLIGFFEVERDLESLIQAELDREEFTTYNQVFDRFEMPACTRAAVLSRIYPFEQFLDADLKPIREYVYSEDSKRPDRQTKRDRSEGAFKLTLGMGKILHQSGGSSSWKAGGSKYARTALWLYVKSIIVMGRSKPKAQTDFTKAFPQVLKALNKPQVAQHWLDGDLVKAIAYETSSSEEVAALRIHYECCLNKKGDLRTSATAGRFTRMLYKALLKELGS